MQWVVNHRHTLESGDLKTAFLSGDVDEARMGDEAIHVDMPADVKSWIRLGPDEALRLRKAVYGLINAPLRWHLRLSGALKEAGFTPLLMDECVWILADEIPPQAAPTEVAQMLRDRMAGQRENPTTWATRKVHGVLGVHVDDLIGGGNAKFQKAITWLKSELEFGAWEQTKFRFRGRELEQTTDKKAIRVSMGQYVDGMEPVTIPKEVRSDLDANLSPQLHS